MMLLTALISITLLFVLLTALRRAAPFHVCALCAAVSTTWIGLLVVGSIRPPFDPVLIALLMGQSTIGILYLLERRLPTQWHLFRLPYYLTTTALVYSIVTPAAVPTVALPLGIAWLMFIVFFLFRTTPRMRTLVTSIMACCKNW